MGNFWIKLDNLLQNEREPGLVSNICGVPITFIIISLAFCLCTDEEMVRNERVTTFLGMILRFIRLCLAFRPEYMAVALAVAIIALIVICYLDHNRYFLPPIEDPNQNSPQRKTSYPYNRRLAAYRSDVSHSTQREPLTKKTPPPEAVKKVEKLSYKYDELVRSPIQKISSKVEKGKELFRDKLRPKKSKRLFLGRKKGPEKGRKKGPKKWRCILGREKGPEKQVEKGTELFQDKLRPKKSTPEEHELSEINVGASTSKDTRDDYDYGSIQVPSSSDDSSDSSPEEAG